MKKNCHLYNVEKHNNQPFSFARGREKNVIITLTIIRIERKNANKQENNILSSDIFTPKKFPTEKKKNLFRAVSRVISDQF